MYRSLLEIEREIARPCVRAHACEGETVGKVQTLHQEREKEKERKKERKKEIERERKRESERERGTESGREKERERQRDRERQRERDGQRLLKRRDVINIYIYIRGIRCVGAHSVECALRYSGADALDLVCIINNIWVYSLIFTYFLMDSYIIKQARRCTW